MTPQIALLKQELDRVFGPDIISLGVTNCRHINNDPHRPWSQHAWSNAYDVSTRYWKWRFLRPSYRMLHNRLLDDVMFYVNANSERLRIREKLWRQPAHWDHIHFSCWPRGWDIPPCSSGGKLKTKDRDGTIRDTFTVKAPLPSLEEPMNIEWTPDRIRAAFSLPGVDGDAEYYITGEGRKGGADGDAWPNFIRKAESGLFDQATGAGLPVHTHTVTGEAK